MKRDFRRHLLSAHDKTRANKSARWITEDLADRFSFKQVINVLHAQHLTQKQSGPDHTDPGCFILITLLFAHQINAGGKLMQNGSLKQEIKVGQQKRAKRFVPQMSQGVLCVSSRTEMWLSPTSSRENSFSPYKLYQIDSCVVYSQWMYH